MCDRRLQAWERHLAGEDSRNPTRFLLYIDILGFKEMTLTEPRKVTRIYSILDRLNVFDHPNFKTIVFSDTILTYNPTEVHTHEEREYLVWYLTEFAEDLHHRLIGQDVWFRAVLVAGDFNHYRLNNIECFFGASLITAYLAEKKLPLIGLAMHRSCQPYNRYFQVEPFTNDYAFVCLARQLREFSKVAGQNIPFQDSVIEDLVPAMPEAVRFLRDLHTLMRSHEEPAVRAKALATWDFYSRCYPQIVAALVQADFSLDALAPPGTWSDGEAVLEANIKYYKRIGAGTELSRRITDSGQQLRARRKAIF